MSKSVKFAVSVPDSVFKKLEALRKKEGLSRSEFIRRVIKNWKEKIEKEKLVKRYVEGYKRIPEDLTNIEAFEKTSFSSLVEEEW